MSDRTYTHIVVWKHDADPMPVTQDEARQIQKDLRAENHNALLTVDTVYTYNHVVRQYVAADAAATRADKTIRGLLCGGWREWSPEREELWERRSEAAHAKLEKWGPLLSLLENAEREMDEEVA